MKPNQSYLDVVYKSDFHTAGNFAGVHAEGKHVIHGSSHVSDDLSPLNPDTDASSPGRTSSDLRWWRCEPYMLETTVALLYCK